MPTSPIEIARGLIRRHGVRAEAVADEHAAELRDAGEPGQLAYWQSVSGTVARLRSRSRQDGSGPRASEPRASWPPHPGHAGSSTAGSTEPARAVAARGRCSMP